MSIEKIKNYMNSNKWDKIYDIIKKIENIPLLTKDVVNGNNIIHLSIINN